MKDINCYPLPFRCCNMSKELKGSLYSIVKQITEVNRGIEIFISGNVSTDETSYILEAHSKKYKFIRYSKNEKNLGFALNLTSAAEKSGPSSLFNELRLLPSLMKLPWVYKIFHCCYCKRVM